MHDKRILLSSPHMGGEEINQIQNAFDLNPDAQKKCKIYRKNPNLKHPVKDIALLYHTMV